MKPIRIAIIGFGKIAGDQHVPAIAGDPRLELAATSSRSGTGPQPRFTDWKELIRTVPDLDAVAITTPPEPRFAIARACLEAGLHVLLEKPPTATLSEADDLGQVAQAQRRTLFASWHARHNSAVARAAEALAGKRVESMDIRWLEDVRKWHPGQQWIWKAGGFGVFDPGINAFSIATQIFPGALYVDEADLMVPQGSQTPVAASVRFASDAADGPLTCTLDWRCEQGEEWTIRVRTSDGTDILLSEGGARLSISGCDIETHGPGEYPDIYRRFVDLVDLGRSDVDVRPLRLVADCLLVGSRSEVEAVAP